jgi:hypothetical protein
MNLLLCWRLYRYQYQYFSLSCILVFSLIVFMSSQLCFNLEGNHVKLIGSIMPVTTRSQSRSSKGISANSSEVVSSSSTLISLDNSVVVSVPTVVSTSVPSSVSNETLSIIASTSSDLSSL